MSIILFFIVVVLLVMIITSTVRIVPQAHAYVVERLGAYQGTWSIYRSCCKQSKFKRTGIGLPTTASYHNR